MSPCLQCSSFQAYWQAPQRVQRPKAGKARKTHRNVARNGDLIYRDFKDYIRNYMGLYGIIWEIEYLCGLWDFMEYPRDKLLQKDVENPWGKPRKIHSRPVGLIFHTTSMLVYARVADPAKSGRYNKQCIWQGDLSCIVARLLGCYHHFWGCMQPEKLRLWPMNLSTCN